VGELDNILDGLQEIQNNEPIKNLAKNDQYDSEEINLEDLPDFEEDLENTSFKRK
jgi:hypothetical protein